MSNFHLPLGKPLEAFLRRLSSYIMGITLLTDLGDTFKIHNMNSSPSAIISESRHIINIKRNERIFLNYIII